MCVQGKCECAGVCCSEGLRLFACVEATAIGGDAGAVSDKDGTARCHSRRMCADTGG